MNEKKQVSHSIETNASANVNWSGHALDLWPLTLKTFTAVSTHTANICGQCR